MKGAREYATLLSSGRSGRLVWQSGSHARGKTFHIWVVEDENSSIRYDRPAGPNTEVFGVNGGGQRGWEETYGWLHKGPWVKDFEAIVAAKKQENKEANKNATNAKQKREKEQHDNAMSLLVNYIKETKHE